jgi:hypothetical protein
MLLREELNAIFDSAFDRVQVACDENHAHTALNECIAPNPGQSADAVTICKLVEHIRRADRMLAEVGRSYTLDRDEESDFVAVARNQLRREKFSMIERLAGERRREREDG